MLIWTENYHNHYQYNIDDNYLENYLLRKVLITQKLCFLMSVKFLTRANLDEIFDKKQIFNQASKYLFINQ